MSKKEPKDAAPVNQLLAALPSRDHQNLMSKLEPIRLTFGDTIYKPSEIIRQLYFPAGGIVSLLATGDDRSRLEIGIVGREGIVGIPVFLGVERSSSLAICQGEGGALKIASSDFLTLCKKSVALNLFVRRYTHSLLIQVSQAAICNRFHKVDARLARWLLTTQDRMESDEFRLTQEFLSVMLGVRREAITIAAGRYQRQEIIRYSRGTIEVLDRKSLVESSCKCYSTIKREERLMYGRISE